MKLFFDSLLANIVGKRFLRHFANEVQKLLPTSCDQVLEQTRITAQELYKQNLIICPDAQTRVILGLCCLTLTGYRELLGRTHDSQVAFLAVTSVVSHLFQGFGKFMFRPLLWLSSDPVKVISRVNWKKWNQLIYGKGMEFDQEFLPNRATLIVNRCVFHQFFTDQGEPHLTQAFCAWDRLWMDVVDDSSRPIRMERPTTISTGANCCQFQCVRDMAKGKKPRSDVILEQ